MTKYKTKRHNGNTCQDFPNDGRDDRGCCCVGVGLYRLRKLRNATSVR